MWGGRGGGGGQRPFAFFPKIHPFWYRHASLSHFCDKMILQETYLAKHMQKHADRVDKRAPINAGPGHNMPSLSDPYWPGLDYLLWNGSFNSLDLRQDGSPGRHVRLSPPASCRSPAWGTRPS